MHRMVRATIVPRRPVEGDVGGNYSKTALAASAAKSPHGWKSPHEFRKSRVGGSNDPHHGAAEVDVGFKIRWPPPLPCIDGSASDYVVTAPNSFGFLATNANSNSVRLSGYA